MSSIEYRPFLLPQPDLTTERLGNTATSGVWHFDSGKPGRHVMLSALIHGNELCGAWALKSFLAYQLRPKRGKITLAFCNLAAFDRFDASNNETSRFVEEDMNRVWDQDKLGDPWSQERKRALEIKPWLEQADWLLDFHSMGHADAPLQLSGVLPHHIALAQRLVNPAHIISDKGHQAGTRMRDYGDFGRADLTDKCSLLIECGFHGAMESVATAYDIMARFLIEADVCDTVDFPSSWFLPNTKTQLTLQVTDAIMADSTDFTFTTKWDNLQVVEKAGTVLAHEHGNAIVTPYDNCVLIMPNQGQIKAKTTVVRLAKITNSFTS